MQVEYARRYRTLWERHWWWRSREAWVLGWVDRLHRREPRSRILDVGCGDGLFFDRLSRYGEVDGLEPDQALVADPRWRARIQVGSIEDGTLAGRAYDLVLMLDVLEHIEDDARAVAEARRALRPGGHLLLTVPALAWLWSRHDEVNEHHRRYARPGLKRLLNLAGFAVETVRYFFVWTLGPLLVRRALAPAGGVSDYDVPIPPPAVNEALRLWSSGEHAVGRVVRWPLGSSLMAIARRPEES